MLEIPSQPSLHDPILGLQFGNFRVDSRLGAGGFATVYKGIHVDIASTVAIKILNINRGQDPTLVQRFRREAQIIAKLNHSNIIRLVDFGHHNRGLLYITMDMLEGNTLRQELKAKIPLPIPFVSRIAHEICEGLKHAHQHGVIHRDLKPANIFLVRQGLAPLSPKIIDFGIASIVSNNASLTHSGVTMGSPSYMSPEQASGNSRLVDARTDLYSLGIIVFHMLTGEKPFQGGSGFDLLIKHVDYPAPTLQERCPGKVWTTSLEAFIAKALAKRREERFQSAAEFQRECVEALEKQRRYETQHNLLEELPTFQVALPINDAEIPLPTESTLTEPEAHTVETTLPSGTDGATKEDTIISLDVPAESQIRQPILVGVVLGLLIGGVLIFAILRAYWKPAAKQKTQRALVLEQPRQKRVAPVKAATPSRLLFLWLRSRPAGATIVSNGATIGTTPLRLQGKLGEKRAILLRLSGYRTHSGLFSFRRAKETHDITLRPLLRKPTRRKAVRTKPRTRPRAVVRMRPRVRPRIAIRVVPRVVVRVIPRRLPPVRKPAKPVPRRKFLTPANPFGSHQ